MRSQQVMMVAAAAALSLGALAGCSSSSTNSSAGAGDSSAPGSASVTGVRPGTAFDQAGSRSADASKASAADLLDRQIISTGQIALQSKDVAATRQQVFTLVSGWHGQVSDEQATSNPDGTMRHTHLTLRVPSSTFDTAMTALARVGHTVSQQRTAEDVTTQVIDTNARVQAKKRAVQQLEALLNRATTLGQVIQLEGDIADRQAELESLQQQQAWLRDQTSMSTIDLTIDRAPRPAHGATHEAGLFAGLSGGWHALGAVAIAALTAVGAVLPFAVVLAIVGTPIWWWRRRTGAKLRETS